MQVRRRASGQKFSGAFLALGGPASKRTNASRVFGDPLNGGNGWRSRADLESVARAGAALRAGDEFRVCDQTHIFRRHEVRHTLRKPRLGAVPEGHWRAADDLSLVESLNAPLARVVI
jgi:hypothetical protein